MMQGHYWGLSARGREALWDPANQNSSRVVWHMAAASWETVALCGQRLVALPSLISGPGRVILTARPVGGRKCGRCLRIAALDNA